MSELIRYSEITKGLRREFLLLQGTGCRWRKCTFCDYYLDESIKPFEVNKPILSMVTGKYGVLDIINSGSAMEFDPETISLIREVVQEKKITDLWFEAHWMYHKELESFSKNFPCRVHYRTGVESFNPDLRIRWKKGIGRDVTPEMIRQYFEGICLLVGMEGQTEDDIMESVRIAESLFDYYSVNLFCQNSSQERRNDELSEIFIKKLAPEIMKSHKAEVLIENTDLGVG